MKHTHFQRYCSICLYFSHKATTWNNAFSLSWKCTICSCVTVVACISPISSVISPVRLQIPFWGPTFVRYYDVLNNEILHEKYQDKIKKCLFFYFSTIRLILSLLDLNKSFFTKLLLTLMYTINYISTHIRFCFTFFTLKLCCINVVKDDLRQKAAWGSLKKWINKYRNCIELQLPPTHH